MLKSFLFITLLCCSKIVAAKDLVFVNSLKALNSSQRIIALNMHFDTVQVEKKNLRYIDQLLPLLYTEATKQNDIEFKHYISYLQLVKKAIYSASTNERISIYKKALRHFEAQNSPVYVSLCTYYLGQNYFVLEQYELAFEYILSAREKFKEIGFEKIPVIGKVLHDLALNYYFFGDYKEVIELMQQAIALPVYSPNLDVQRFNNMASAYQELNKIDSAAIYLQKTIARASFYRDSTWIGLASSNLAKLYLKKGRLKEALALYKTNFDHNKDHYREPQIAKKALLDMARVLLLLNRKAEAFDCIRASDQIKLKSSEIGFGDLQYYENMKSLYFEVQQLYALKNADYKSAYVYLDSMNALAVVKAKKYNAVYIKQEQVKQKIQKHLGQAELKAKTQELSATRLWFVAGITVLLTVTFALLYYISRIRRSRDNARNKYHQSVLEQQKAAADKELLHTKNALEGYILSINQKNNQIAEINQELDGLYQSKDSEQRNKRIGDAVERLQTARLLTNKDWRDFQANFNEVHKDFLTVLNSKYPQLTASEIRYLMLVKLNLDNKEMASMLGVSVESVRVTSHRLRKKTGIAIEALLQELAD